MNDLGAQISLLHKKQQPDYVLLCLWFSLLSVGLVMVASSSVAFAENNYGDEWFFVKRHMIFILMSLAAAIVMYFIPTKYWRRYSPLLMGLSIFVLILVLIPGVGIRVNGSQRWVNLGFFSMQASEVLKFCALMFFADYFAKNYPGENIDLKIFGKAISILILIAFLLLLEPDLGSAVVLSATFFGLVFIAGIKLRYILSMSVGGVSLLFVMIYVSPYRLKRLVAYKDPWADQFNDGYQLTQSLIAFGRGEWLGVGLGNSLQKLFYLPEAHTDFIFAVYAEEFGLVGVLVVIGLFSGLIIRMLSIVRRSLSTGNIFLAYAVFGVATLLSLQLFINVGVAAGLLPTKGLTLPFISYGGSSLIISCVLMAFVLRAELENRTCVVEPVRKITNRSRVKKYNSKADAAVLAGVTV